MCTIRIYVILVGITQMCASFDSMFDVAHSKPALFWSFGKGNQNIMNYLLNINSEMKNCQVQFSSDRGKHLHIIGYTVDVKSIYVFREISISFLKDNIHRNYSNLNVKVYIDKVLCEDIEIKERDDPKQRITVVLNCKTNKGREITVTSELLKICHLQAFVCPSGMKGVRCREMCSSSYGLSCSLPCNCRRNTTCNRLSGFCENGCANSEGPRHTDCFFKSVETSHKSFYTDISHEAESILSSSSHRYFDNSCITLPFSESSQKNHIWIEWNYTLPIHLSAFEAKIPKISLNHTAIFRLTVDNRTCLETILKCQTLNGAPCPENLLEFTSKEHVCYTRNLRGKSVKLSITKRGYDQYDEDIEDEQDMVKLCDVKLLTCHPGFYGPFCRLPCNCLVLPCHPKTGNCLDGRCTSGNKGFNCGLVDVTKDDNTLIMNDKGTKEDIPPLFPKGPKPLPVNHENVLLWTSVRSVELPGTYRVNHITFTLDISVVHKVRKVSVYTDMSWPDHSLLERDETLMNGLPCMISTQSTPDSRTLSVECPWPASTVTLVAFGASPLNGKAIEDLQLWTCRDGTFGHRCEKVCNCKHADDVCDKLTGHCISGCPPSYQGPDCQEELCLPGKCEISCPGDKDGICQRKCHPGWMGEACVTPCPDGFYGEACRHVCHECVSYDGEKVCDPINGTCLHGCKESSSLSQLCPRTFLLDSGKKEKDGEKSSVHNPAFVFILLVCIIGGILALCFIIILCKFLYRKWSRRHSIGSSRSKYAMYSSDASRFERSDLVTQGNQAVGQMFKTMEEGWRWVSSLETPGEFEDWPESTITTLQKVAIWILSQNFDELIARRRERLARAAENLSLEESSYDMELLPLSSKEIVRLYDEVR